MRRFVMFAGNKTVPERGFSSFAGAFETQVDAINHYNNSNHDGHFDWCQIIDIKLGKLSWSKGLLPKEIAYIKLMLDN